MVIPVLTPNSKRNVIHKKRPNTLLDPTTAGAGAERKMESTDDMSVEISWVDDGEYSIGTRDEVEEESPKPRTAAEAEAEAEVEVEAELEPPKSFVKSRSSAFSYQKKRRAKKINKQTKKLQQDIDALQEEIRLAKEAKEMEKLKERLRSEKEALMKEDRNDEEDQARAVSSNRCVGNSVSDSKGENLPEMLHRTQSLSEPIANPGVPRMQLNAKSGAKRLTKSTVSKQATKRSPMKQQQPTRSVSDSSAELPSIAKQASPSLTKQPTVRSANTQSLPAKKISKEQPTAMKVVETSQPAPDPIAVAGIPPKRPTNNAPGAVHNFSVAPKQSNKTPRLNISLSTRKPRQKKIHIPRSGREAPPDTLQQTKQLENPQQDKPNRMRVSIFAKKTANNKNVKTQTTGKTSATAVDANKKSKQSKLQVSVQQTNKRRHLRGTKLLNQKKSTSVPSKMKGTMCTHTIQMSERDQLQEELKNMRVAAKPNQPPQMMKVKKENMAVKKHSGIDDAIILSKGLVAIIPPPPEEYANDEEAVRRYNNLCVDPCIVKPACFIGQLGDSDHNRVLEEC